MNETSHKIWRRLLLAGGCLVLWLDAALPLVGATNAVPITPLAVASSPTVELLVWDVEKGVTKFAVNTGKARNVWTNRTVIATNYVILKPGVVYGISAISPEGIDGPLAYWPSNKLGQIRIHPVGQTNYTTLRNYTNSPPFRMELWQIEDVTLGWY